MTRVDESAEAFTNTWTEMVRTARSRGLQPAEDVVGAMWVTTLERPPATNPLDCQRYRTRTLALNARRDRDRRRIREIPTSDPNTLSVGAAMKRDTLVEDMRELIHSVLPKDARQVVELHIAGWTDAEIAEECGRGEDVSKEVSKIQEILRRAREQLRRSLTAGESV